MAAQTSSIDGPRRRSSRDWLLVGSLEVLFWAPPVAIPIVAKLVVGEHVWRSDVQSCVFMSMVLAFIGTCLGRWQGVYRTCLFAVLALGSLIITGITLSKQGGLDPFAMLAIIDTGRGEAADFSKHYGAGDVALATWWLSNQPQYSGLSEDGIALLSSAASQIWLNDPSLDSGDGERRNFDSDVLAPLQKLLAKPEHDKFIFVHLMGSHDYYQSRYPPAAEYFASPADARPCLSAKQRETINQYDSSVRFNDSVVGRIIDMVRSASGESFVLYFSDHGEEVYDYRDFAGHSDVMMSPYNAEVPLALWMSPAYRQNRCAFVSRLGAGADRSFDTGDLLYAISDLAGLSFPGMEGTRSLFSERFAARPRTTAGQDYDQFVQSWRPDAAHAAPAPLLGCGLSLAAAEAPRR